MKDLDYQLEILIQQTQEFLEYILKNPQHTNSTKEQCVELSRSLQKVIQARSNLIQIGKFQHPIQKS
jgi:hypothetical protein